MPNKPSNNLTNAFNLAKVAAILTNLATLSLLPAHEDDVDGSTLIDYQVNPDKISATA